jgi:hypothetical protein
MRNIATGYGKVCLTRSVISISKQANGKIGRKKIYESLTTILNCVIMQHTKGNNNVSQI